MAPMHGKIEASHAEIDDIAQHEERFGIKAIRATPFVWRDPRSIPPRRFLYGRHLIEKFISSTVAPGGVGKSSLALVEIIAMVTGRDLLGVAPPRKLRAWYWNGEDPPEEIERRIAAVCLRYGIDHTELESSLFINSGRTSPIILATETKAGLQIAEPVAEAIIRNIKVYEIDVLVIDPFVASHAVGENDNAKINAVARQWAKIADTTGIAIDLVHHVRKGQSGQGEFTVDDGRGASALKDAVRSARVLNVMSKEEAEKAGVENNRLFFRIDNGKSNLAPPPDKTEWFQLVSVDLGNGDNDMPGDSVGVVTRWTFPDPFDGVTVNDLRAAQEAVSAGGPWRENCQATDWVGKPIAEALRLDIKNPSHAMKVKMLLKTWIENRMFVCVEGLDAKRNKRVFVEVGQPA
jgi:hypothetical protein